MQDQNLIYNFGQYALKRMIKNEIQIVSTPTRVDQDERIIYE